MSAPLNKRLLEACVGYPDAKIKWPHHLLHEAAAAITAANKALDLVKDARPTNPLHAFTTFEISHAVFIACGEARVLLQGMDDASPLVNPTNPN